MNSTFAESQKRFLYLFCQPDWFERDGKYFSRSTVRTKIGVTGNPKARLSNLKTGAPDCDFRAVWFFGECSGCFTAAQIEADLHEYYKNVCIGGEWFELPHYEFLWLENCSVKFFQDIDAHNGFRLVLRHPWTEREKALQAATPYVPVRCITLPPEFPIKFRTHKP